MVRFFQIALIFILAFTKSYCQQGHISGRKQTIFISTRDRNKFKIDIRKDSFLVQTNKGINYIEEINSNEGIWRPYATYQDSIIFQGVMFPKTFGQIDTRPNPENSSHFKGALTIFDSQFIKPVWLQNSIFEKPFLISRVAFLGNIRLTNCYFKDKVSLKLCLFKYNSDTIINQPYGIIDLGHSTFYGTLSFSNSFLGNSLELNDAKFTYMPKFDGAILPVKLNFSNSSFNNDNTLGLASKIDLRRTVIPKIGDSLRQISSFGNSSIYKKIINERPKSDAKCTIYLQGSDVSRFIVPYEKFILGFDNTTYEEEISIYEAIINTCKQFGMTESAQSWGIEYKKKQFNMIGQSSGKLSFFLTTIGGILDTKSGEYYLFGFLLFSGFFCG